MAALAYSFLNQNIDYSARIKAELGNCLNEVSMPLARKTSGKVRDVYDLGAHLLLITTDRQSAFDRVLACVPFKGQVLNQISAWWFEQTRDIVTNHFVELPDPNAMLARKCVVFPIEFVVRGYITGSTSTALWSQYQQGAREYCGNRLSEGLVKNQVLETPILTPTTKDAEHDRPIAPAAIIAENRMTASEWEACSQIAFNLFKRGQQLARQNGLILVDTKYEMGRDEVGNIVLIDEVHTPDSSRYWIAASYAELFRNGQEPENIDKEFLRLWFKEHCNPYQDKTLPAAPEDLVIELSRRYIYLYEMITGQPFDFPSEDETLLQRMQRNLSRFTHA